MIDINLTHAQLLQVDIVLCGERDNLKAELAALREQRVPMTEDQIINLVIKCEKDWNKCAAESNQWKDLYWEEYAVVICRAIEAFQKIESRS